MSATIAASLTGTLAFPIRARNRPRGGRTPLAGATMAGLSVGLGPAGVPGPSPTVLAPGIWGGARVVFSSPVGTPRLGGGTLACTPKLGGATLACPPAGSRLVPSPRSLERVARARTARGLRDCGPRDAGATESGADGPRDAGATEAGADGPLAAGATGAGAVGPPSAVGPGSGAGRSAGGPGLGEPATGARADVSPLARSGTLTSSMSLTSLSSSGRSHCPVGTLASDEGGMSGA